MRSQWRKSFGRIGVCLMATRVRGEGFLRSLGLPKYPTFLNTWGPLDLSMSQVTGVTRQGSRGSLQTVEGQIHWEKNRNEFGEGSD